MADEDKKWKEFVERVRKTDPDAGTFTDKDDTPISGIEIPEPYRSSNRTGFVKQRLRGNGEPSQIDAKDKEPTPIQSPPAPGYESYDKVPGSRELFEEQSEPAVRVTQHSDEDITAVMIDPHARGEALSALRRDLEGEMMLISVYAQDRGYDEYVISGAQELHFAYSMFDLGMIPRPPDKIISEAQNGKKITAMLEELTRNGCEAGPTIELMVADGEYNSNIQELYFKGLARDMLLRRFRDSKTAIFTPKKPKQQKPF